MAAASARASRAEQSQRKAETERIEADAVEASELADQHQTSLAETLEQLETEREALNEFTGELRRDPSCGEARDLQAQAELREQLGTTQTRLAETEQARDAATTRAEGSATARAEADERARGALDLARRAEADAVGIREQLGKALTQRDELREETSTLRSTVATITVERNAARTDTERGSAHGDQRVADLRLTHDQQLTQLRSELAVTRQEAREQRT